MSEAVPAGYHIEDDILVPAGYHIEDDILVPDETLPPAPEHWHYEGDTLVPDAPTTVYTCPECRTTHTLTPYAPYCSEGCVHLRRGRIAALERQMNALARGDTPLHAAPTKEMVAHIKTWHRAAADYGRGEG